MYAPSSRYADAAPLPLPPGSKPIQLDTANAYHIGHWGRMSDPQRLAALRRMAEQRGMDPRIRELVFRILRGAGVGEREYEKQAAVLLKWVQDEILYLNEPNEILQDPLYTLRVKAGDCDDKAILLATFYHAIRLPWRYVLSGVGPVQADGRRSRIRWVEGTPLPRGFTAAHIYLAVGWAPFKPTTWRWAEPTIKGKPLGWDVTTAMAANGGAPLPELAGLGNPGVLWGLGASAPAVPIVASGAGIAASAAAAGTSTLWKQVGIAVLVGTAVTVGSQYLLRWLEHHKIVPSRGP